MLACIKNFYDSHKHAILWTVGYVIATWAIMRYLFDFNIFSGIRWHQLMHAHLRGFAGLVFGILILAMVPLYVATTIVIARNNEPIFNLKLTIPECIKTFIKNAFVQTPMDGPQSESDPITVISEPEQTIEPEPETTEPTTEPIPESVPAELRVAYARARDHIGRAQTSVFDLSNITKKSAPIIQNTQDTTPESEMPIPTNFDIADTQSIINDVPVFTDLDFDDEEDADINEPAPQINDIKNTTGDNGLVIKYLTAKSVSFNTENDVVVTDKFAIVSHTDSDFWVADNESWFAAGKIRKSPIASVIEAAKQHNVQPVLYLGTDNIMDIEHLCPQWESSGIRVISDLKNLI